jgi:hypothetical protein
MIDLTQLTGDQLLQVAQSVSQEIATRAIAVQVAYANQWQDANQRIEDAVRQTKMAEKDQLKIALNSKKATIIAFLKELEFFRGFKHDNFVLQVQVRDSDIRLRIKSKKYELNYFHTGNKWAPARSINAPALDPKFFHGFREFCSLLCTSFPDGIECSYQDDLRHQIDSALLIKYREQLLCLI